MDIIEYAKFKKMSGGGSLSEEEKSKIADEVLNEALGGEY